MKNEQLEIFKMINGFTPNEKECYLFERTSDISSSEFPLIDFLNDVFRRKFDKNYCYDLALEDFEKVLDYVVHLRGVEDNISSDAFEPVAYGYHNGEF